MNLIDQIVCLVDHVVDPCRLIGSQSVKSTPQVLNVLRQEFSLRDHVSSQRHLFRLIGDFGERCHELVEPGRKIVLAKFPQFEFKL